MELLKYSLLSKSSLTDFFLRNKPFLERTSFSPCDILNNSSLQIKLKLFFRKTDGELLFAQGEEDFADFLVNFLTFPLGGVVRMLGGDSSLGSIDSLYQSILELDENKYLMSNNVHNRLNDPMSFKEVQQGYVKGPSPFIVANDLVLQPMSPISTMSLLSRLETPPSNVTEKVVFIGVKEV